MAKFILLLAILVAYSVCLNFGLNGDNPFCMRYEGGKKYTLEYVVSGMEDENVKCTIMQGKNIVLEKELVPEF
jgi:hypothetical protein